MICPEFFTPPRAYPTGHNKRHVAQQNGIIGVHPQLLKDQPKLFLVGFHRFLALAIEEVGVTQVPPELISVVFQFHRLTVVARCVSETPHAKHGGAQV